MYYPFKRVHKGYVGDIEDICKGYTRKDKEYIGIHAALSPRRPRWYNPCFCLHQGPVPFGMWVWFRVGWISLHGMVFVAA